MNQVIIRDHFPYFLNELNLLGTAVEIGVCEGKFAELFRERWKGQLYVMVDPWVETVANNESTGPWSQAQHTQYYNTTVARMKRFPESSYKIIRSTSNPTYKEFADGSVDFVYLDGDHSYTTVSDDLRIWWPKIRDGGILAGHDYYNVPVGRGLPGWNWGMAGSAPNDNPVQYTAIGVKAAVDEFVERNRQELRIIDPAFQPSWYFIKYTPQL